MSTPAIIYLALSAISLLYIAYLHGKAKEGKYNIFISLTSSALIFWLLYWGGFFS